MAARFQQCADGYRLVVDYVPQGQARGALLFIHPFAEEMNKSRRAVANAARELARNGWHVSTLDLLGCGDSSGDFADATWDAWINDVVMLWQLLAHSQRTTPILWALRTGALLAVEAITRLPQFPDLVFWQPVLSGRTFLNQFLRMKVAAQMLGQEGAAASTKGLRAELEAGRSVEVAGYTLNPALAMPLERAELDPPGSNPGRVLWCEIAAHDADIVISPAAAARQARWQSAGADVHTLVVDGLAFWQTPEIAECSKLATATVNALERICA